jgi:hypothetical protein
MSDYQPPTLTAALDAGIDLTEWPRLSVLAESAVMERAMPPGQRFRAVALRLQDRDDALDGDDHAWATYCQWAAELAEDLSGELTERLRAALPPDVRDAIDATAEKAHSPHPLTTADPCDHGATFWRCGNCGAASDPGRPALIVGDREGYSDLPYPIFYCRECVTAAATAIDVLDQGGSSGE